MGESKSELAAGKEAPCTYCGQMVETNGGRTYQRGYGWFPKRKSAKGSHSATNVTYVYEFACWECMDKISHGIPVQQMRLFPIPYDNG